MESFEKKILIELLKTIKKCDDRLKDLESIFLKEPSHGDIEDIITPVTKELMDEIIELTGSKLVFMAIA